jgi:hypothetical protein
MGKGWDLSQRINVRASTALMLLLPLLGAMQFASEHLPTALAVPLIYTTEMARAMSPGALLAVAAMSLAFLISTFLRRNPQGQFAIELMVALQLFAVASRRMI